LAMLEFAYYSVISPEGCAAILWRDGSQAADAAQALKLSSKDLYKLELIDAIIPEPLGGAHRNVHDTIYNIEGFIGKTLADLKRTKIENLLESRYKKLRSMGSNCVNNRRRQRAIAVRISAVAKAVSAKSKSYAANLLPRR
ncbi:MAG: hypothetical protein MUO33_01445, partial [Sedimentisphaerales bacterium]|nr:hypothetical protein [Sedimentisphaerales bacterium]